MRHHGITILCIGAALASSCRSPYDHGAIYDRSDALYGATIPWYESGGEPLALPEQADLASYLQFGLQHNGALRASFHRWCAAVERATRAAELPDPVFTYAHFIEDIETRTGPQRQRFSLQQTFPWFGVLALREEVAAGEVEVEWWKVVAERAAVVREIKRAYYEYAYLAQAIRIDEGNLGLLRQLEPVAQRRVQAGASQQDLIRVQVEIGRLENELQTLRKFRPALSARLGAAMNRKRASVLPFPDALEIEVSEVDVESLIALVLRDNPGIGELRSAAARAGKSAELADLSGWPDITLGADYFETGDAVTPIPGSGNDPIAIRVSMNLPIWRGSYAAQKREARRLEAAAQGQLRQRESRLRADLEQVAYELDDAGRQIALYRDTLLPRARQSFEVTQTAYRAATSTLLDVIDAERTLLAFEKAYWRATSDYGQSLADLEALCGGEIR